jgi:hypothetical protein
MTRNGDGSVTYDRHEQDVLIRSYDMIHDALQIAIDRLAELREMSTINEIRNGLQDVAGLLGEFTTD